MANLFHGNTFNNFIEVNILLEFMNFLTKLLTRASIETLKHNSTSYKHFFFLRIVFQTNKSYVITHYLFA